MRLVIHLQCDQLVLPINHRQILQAAIYANLSKDTSDEIHNTNDEGTHHIKRFVFSKIIGSYEIVDKLICFNGPATLLIASDQLNFLNDLFNHLNNQKYIILSHQKVIIKNIIPLFPTLKDGIITYKTVSPVTLYSTENNYTNFYGPSDEDYGQLLFNNLLNKNNNEYPNYFIIHDIQKVKRGVFKYKDFSYVAYDYTITIETTSKIHTIIQDCGLGSRNAIGFGMVEIYEA